MGRYCCPDVIGGVSVAVPNLAIFLYNPILHDAYSSLLKENNSANNRLPLEYCFQFLLGHIVPVVNKNSWPACAYRIFYGFGVGWVGGL